jgi:formylmethanofuran--tetrahydromethanopterin N-formyltransferase
VGGGNLLILGTSMTTALGAAKAAVKAMRKVEGVILPFPDGVVRSGSKVGSKYKTLMASTNHQYCPTLRGIVDDSVLADDEGCVLEIVIDGLTEEAVADAMRRGMHAAARRGIRRITAGNYGGNLGQFQIHLHQLIDADPA